LKKFFTPPKIINTNKNMRLKKKIMFSSVLKNKLKFSPASGETLFSSR